MPGATSAVRMLPYFSEMTRIAGTAQWVMLLYSLCRLTGGVVMVRTARAEACGYRGMGVTQLLTLIYPPSLMTRKPYTQGRIFIGRLPQGADLLAAITHIANDEAIKVGTVVVHGAVARASLSLFDPEANIMMAVEREERMEIAGMSGTISQFKGRSMARLNGVLAGRGGATIGGMVTIGTTVLACEVVITELEGGTLSRDFDAATGLPLWKDGSLLTGE